MNENYPHLLKNRLGTVIKQAQKYKIDLSDAEKTVKFYYENGNSYGSQDSILVIDLCILLEDFEKQKEGSDLIRFLAVRLIHCGYLDFRNQQEAMKFWDEFSELIANSDILEKLQGEKNNED